jgi:dTDP-4-dehydrorhamnose reductase
MNILLLGKNGQVGWELQRALSPLGVVTALGHDSPGPVQCPELRADFSQPEQVAALVRAVRPDVIVNAAAHTAVDKAESEPELARALNATTPGLIAQEAAQLGACWCTTAPTTCSMAAATSRALKRPPPRR